MPKKTVKISVKPARLIVFVLIIAAILAIVFLVRKNPKKIITSGKIDSQEVILPQDTGVADSGFELKNTGITALNAKTILDTLEEIDGKQSLKISFMEDTRSSVKVGNYINDVQKDNFYRLSFWAISNSAEDKTLEASISGDNGSQTLGDFTLSSNSGVRYYGFNFQAEGDNVSDLIFTSIDGKKADVWIDNVMIEKLNVNSSDEMNNLMPTISGNTSRFNVDQEQTSDDKDSEDFFIIPNRKAGQIIKPTQPIISSVTLKIKKSGNGGAGDYHLQIREYDERLGVISENIIASRIIYTDYPASILDEVKAKEQEMRDAFDQNETDIREGRIPNDPTVDQYPSDYTQQQIDESKAKKRSDKLNLAIAEMKESFNVPYELNIPISAKLDTGKKYWIGIDSNGVKTTKHDYLKVFYNSKASTSESEPGFVSKINGTWEEYYTLWFKTFYPKHFQVQDFEILSGATISDFGDKLLYRYQFNDNDYTSLSGFPGRKVYDLFESNFKQSDNFGNYELSSGQYAIYKFNTLYPAKKIIIRNAVYDQSLTIDFSSNGVDWKEVFSDAPEEKNQKINPLVINPDSEANVFYLKITPAGSSTILSDLNVEAELGNSE